jgi:prevent-host-death family protein
MAANLNPQLTKGPVQPVQVNLYEAKTQLSSLVERAARGEEIVIAKAGKPMARLSAVTVEEDAKEPLPFGQNLLGLPRLPKSFYEDIPLEHFLGDEDDPLREVLR